MSVDPGVARLRRWLELRTSAPSDAALARALDLVATTPQWVPVRHRHTASGSTDTGRRSGQDRPPATRRDGTRSSAVRMLTAATGLAFATSTLYLVAGQGPSPSLPTPRIVTRDVEPGVVKVVSDDAGHKLDGVPLAGVVVGPQGEVWVLGTTGFAALGRPGVATGAQWPETRRTDTAVAPDGTLWAVGAQGELSRFDGTVWTTDSAVPGAVSEVEVAGDGTVWAAWIGPAVGPADGRPQAGYLGPDGWSAVDDSAIHGGAVTDLTYTTDLSLVLNPSGGAWLGIGFYHGGERRFQGQWRGLLRSDGSAWVVEQPVAGREDLSAGPMAVGPDGTLWVYQAVRSAYDDGDYGIPERYLSRHDQDGWTTYSADDGVPMLVGNSTYGATVAVDRDGTLWIANVDDVPLNQLPPELGPSNPGDCLGVLSFDGATWRRYLAGTCVNDVTIGADGSIWATSRTGWVDDTLYLSDGTVLEARGRDVPQRAGLYRIEPDLTAVP